MNKMTMFDTSIFYALVAGIGIALIAGSMGCFVVWRRMAYFGDSLAHSTLLGIALGLAIGISDNLGSMIICSAFALLLSWLQRKKILATDTLLGILSHAALSIGMITISLLGKEIDLHDYLFGDILTTTPNEIYLIYAGGAIVLSALFLNWSSLLLMTIHEDLAMAENVRIFLMNILLIFLMTIVVAVSIRIVGILLITSMLIIPAATAGQIVNSPEKTAILASLLGIIAVILGIFASIKFDIPSGPSIVVASAVLFVILIPLSCFRLKKI